MSEYKVEKKDETDSRLSGYYIYKKRRFMFFCYWSFMCYEQTFTSAQNVINNLNLINDREGD